MRPFTPNLHDPDGPDEICDTFAKKAVRIRLTIERMRKYANRCDEVLGKGSWQARQARRDADELSPIADELEGKDRAS